MTVNSDFVDSVALYKITVLIIYEKNSIKVYKVL